MPLYDRGPFIYIRIIHAADNTQKKCSCTKKAKYLIIKKRVDGKDIARVDGICEDCVDDTIEKFADYIIQDLRRDRMVYTERQLSIISDIDALSNLTDINNCDCF